jgi:chromosome segregation ATPase
MEHAKNAIVIMVISVSFLCISCTESKVKELQIQLQQKDEEYLRLKNDFSNSQDLNDKQFKDLSTIQEQLWKLDSLSYSFRIVKEGHGINSSTMQEEIETLISKIKEDIRQKKEDIYSLTKEEDKLRTFIESLSAQLDLKEQEINRLKDIVHEQSGQILDLGNKVGWLERRERELNEQIIDLETNKRILEKTMKETEAKTYYNIAVALENAESGIPVLNGIFINSAKKDEVIKTKANLKKQAEFYYKKSSELGYNP